MLCMKEVKSVMKLMSSGLFSHNLRALFELFLSDTAHTSTKQTLIL